MDRRLDLISVDPGFEGTGVVYWRSADQPIWAGVLRPPRVSIKNIVPGEHFDLTRCYDIAYKMFTADGWTWSARHVLIEMPEFQAGAMRQMGWRTGDLQKLTMLVGYLAHAARIQGAKVQLATPSQWKGQLPKEVITQRMTKLFGKMVVEELGVKTHAWDALGIGAWAYGQPWMKGDE